MRRHIGSRHTAGVLRDLSRPRQRLGARPRRRTGATWPSGSGCASGSAPNGRGRCAGLEGKAQYRSGDVVARLSRAVIRRGEWQLGPLDLEVRWADRLAIVGPNGSGKTTLLAALLGRVALQPGALFTGPSVIVGELGQERRRFSEGESTLLGAFLVALGPTAPESEARSLLAKFGLGASHVLRVAASLSPGERTRAELALLVARGTNCLVLDEPTNHLDVPAIEQLEGALEAWEGTLLLVTHDGRLLETVRITERVELGRSGDATALRSTGHDRG